MKGLRNTLACAALVAVCGVPLYLAACGAVDDLLRVDNPARILPGELNNKELIQVLTNSPVGEFQDMYDSYVIWRGSMLTDQIVSAINWEQTARVSQRIVRYDEGPAQDVFEQLSQFRMISDSVAVKLESLVDDPASSAELAQTLAYSGYSYIFMADMMCTADFDIGSKEYKPVEIYQMAVPRFEQAIQTATAAGREDIANLARVGLARAYLDIGGQDAKVMEVASKVPADFVWWAYYHLNSGENDLYGETHGENATVGVHPHFVSGTRAMFLDTLPIYETDPRIQHEPKWRHGHNGLTPLYIPYQGLSYSGYNGETLIDGGQPAEFTRDTNIKMASGLEALHDYYEAAGPNGTGPAGSTLDFVNARRAVGHEAPVQLSGDALMAELREQRGRDFYLGGMRLGDLRRWLRQDNVNLFPQGPHVNAQWGDYGDATCFPLPLSEYEGNPNLVNPHS